MNTTKEKSKEYKWKSGWTAMGAYLDWLIKEHPQAVHISAVVIIASETLGKLNRYSYIKEEKFGLSHNKKYRQIKKLVDMGLLDIKRTKAYTMYSLVLPKHIEKKVNWNKSRDTNIGLSNEVKKIKEIQW